MTTQDERDRVDALISAAMDDELDAAGREELRTRQANDPEVAERVRTFHRIDAGLRGLGSERIPDALLETNLDALHQRLGTHDRESSLVRPVVLPMALAAAAAIVLYLAFADGTPDTREEALARDTRPASEAVIDVVPFDEELAVALGYGEAIDGPSPVPGIPMDDFEIIEDLDLLDFLARREAGGPG